MAEDHFDRHLDFYPSQNIFGTKDEVYSNGDEYVKIEGKDVKRIKEARISIGREKKPATIEKIPFEFRSYFSFGNKAGLNNRIFLIHHVNIFKSGEIEIFIEENKELEAEDKEKAEEMLKKLIRRIKGF